MAGNENELDGRKSTSRLHYFPESGNSYKLALCGQSFEPVWTDFAGGVTRTAEWREAVNAMGEIPVHDLWLTQTAPILLKLAEQYGRFGLESSDERFEVLRWLFLDNHKLSGYMATYRFLRTFTPSPDPNVLEFLRRRLDEFLGILDRHMQLMGSPSGNSQLARICPSWPIFTIRATRPDMILRRATQPSIAGYSA